MTAPGWYPDPAGTPGAYRYWDGRTWSEQTSTDPYGAYAGGPPPAPAGPAAPPSPSTEPAPYGAMPQWTPMPRPAPGSAPAGPPPDQRTGRTIAIALAAVLVLVLLAALAFVGVKVLGGDDDTVAHPPGTDDTTEVPSFPEPSVPTVPGVPQPTLPTLPTPTPHPPLGSITPSPTQCSGSAGSIGIPGLGRTISAGGLTAPSLSRQGYSVDLLNATGFEFATGVVMVSKYVTSSWLSPLMLGTLPRTNGFRSPEQAARTAMECFADDPTMYSGGYRLTEVSAGATTVDGHRAFSLVEDVRVHNASVGVPGDRVQIIVVDTGNRRGFGIYLMAVPIGDKPLLALQKATAQQLHAR